MVEMLQGNDHVTELCMTLLIVLLLGFHSDECPKTEIREMPFRHDRIRVINYHGLGPEHQ